MAQNNVLLDGNDNSSRTSGGPLGFEAQAVKPPVDAVAEFKVVTNNMSAEYGYRAGAKVLVNTRAGTNEFHGSLYHFLRNDALDATNFFANRSGAQKPDYKQNQFGGTIGGRCSRTVRSFSSAIRGHESGWPKLHLDRAEPRHRRARRFLEAARDSAKHLRSADAYRHRSDRGASAVPRQHHSAQPMGSGGSASSSISIRLPISPVARTCPTTTTSRPPTATTPTSTICAAITISRATTDSSHATRSGTSSATRTVRCRAPATGGLGQTVDLRVTTSWATVEHLSGRRCSTSFAIGFSKFDTRFDILDHRESERAVRHPERSRRQLW